MLIEHEGKKIRIRWQYDHGQRTTKCFVSFNGQAEITAQARCNSKDEWNKETGRKLAMTRAIACFPKATRCAIWDGYWEKTLLEPVMAQLGISNAFNRAGKRIV